METRSVPAKATPESGFSLLELLVSMVIFLVVSAAVWGLLRTAQQSRSAVTEEVQLAKTFVSLSARSRETPLTPDLATLRRAPLCCPITGSRPPLGCRNDFDTSRDTVPPVIAGNNITLSTFATTANTRTDQVTFLYKDKYIQRNKRRLAASEY
ncbi:MAG: prepilin-type N-terminal cleavage/methylation domain-containing protein [Acidobacteria bacterium]|nr:prepilin-type N-terminal cleavage/methylation domain-containing protein [Acidobacteriota bacterium]